MMTEFIALILIFVAELWRKPNPSVREALSALSRKGLVKIASGERARVSRPSADTIISELSGMA